MLVKITKNRKNVKGNNIKKSISGIICIMVLLISLIGMTGCNIKSQKETPQKQFSEIQIPMPKKVASCEAVNYIDKKIYVVGLNQNRKFVGVFSTTNYGGKWKNEVEKKEIGNITVSSACITDASKVYISNEDDNTVYKIELKKKNKINKNIEANEGEEVVYGKNNPYYVSLQDEGVCIERKKDDDTTTDIKIIQPKGIALIGNIVEKGENLYVLNISNKEMLTKYDVKTGKKKQLDKNMKKALENYGKRIEKAMDIAMVDDNADKDDKKLTIVGANGMYKYFDGKESFLGSINSESIRSGRSSISECIKIDDKNYIAKMDKTFSGNSISLLSLDKRSENRTAIQLYSLHGNLDMENIVENYNATNKEYAIEYIVGMEEKGVKTEQQAIKKLKKRIKSGKGPDMVLVDDMPVEEMQKENAFENISEFGEKISNKEYIFSNILKENKNKQYEIPLSFTFDWQVGDKNCCKSKNINELITSLATLNNEDGDVIHDEDRNDIMQAAYRNFAAENIEKNADINTIKDFFKLAEVVRDIKAKCGDEKVKALYELKVSSQHWITTTEPHLLNNSTKYNIGKEGASNIFIIEEIEKNREFDSRILKERSYIPELRIAVTKTGQNKEIVKNIIEKFCQKNNQSLITGGFPVNRLAIKEQLNEDYDDTLSEVYMDDADLIINGDDLLTKSQVQEWLSYLETFDKPVVINNKIAGIVFEYTNKVISGELKVDDAAKQCRQEILPCLTE